MQPTEIRLSRDGTCLSVTWENGATSDFAAALLREKARDANSVRFALNGWAVPAAPGISITGVEPVGSYALRLSFSDGHDRGIFPFAYLTDIAAARTEH